VPRFGSSREKWLFERLHHSRWPGLLFTALGLCSLLLALGGALDPTSTGFDPATSLAQAGFWGGFGVSEFTAPDRPRATAVLRVLAFACSGALLAQVALHLAPV
jgi:hypothetical protein